MEKKIRAGLFIFLMALALFFCVNKQGFFLDELYSYGLSNSVVSGDIIHLGVENTLSPKALFLDYLTVNAGEGFSYWPVIKNQIQDVHPPLYYLLLHTLSSFFPGSFSKWQGLGLNLCFYLGSLVLFYALAGKIFKKEAWVLGALACYGLLPATLSNVIYIRMYVLLTFFTLLLAWLHVKFLQKPHIPYGAGIFLTMALGYCTQYYFVITAFYFGLASTWYFWRKKRGRDFMMYALSMGGGLLFGLALFPYIFSQLFGQNTYLTDAMSGGVIQKMVMGGISFLSNINYGFFGKSGLALCLFYMGILLFAAARRQFKKGQEPISPWILALLWILPLNVLTLLLINWIPASRYYYHLFPFFVLTGIYCLRKILHFLLSKGSRTPYYVLFVLAFVLAVLRGYSLSLFPSSEAAAAPVEYLYPDQGKITHILKQGDTGVLVLTNQNAAMTESLQELSLSPFSYIGEEQNLEKGILELHQKGFTKILLCLDQQYLKKQEISWEEVAKRLEGLGLIQIQYLFSRNLCQGSLWGPLMPGESAPP